MKGFYVSILQCLTFLMILGTGNLLAGDVNLEVRDSYNNKLAGVNVYYNDYGDHYVLLGTTDDGTSNNPVVATLPDGNYRFKAVLNHTEQILDNKPVPGGTVNFQTSEFVVHVIDSDGNDFQGIAVGFNDYGTHYLSMGTTSGDGNASIELFPGTRQFKATKDYTDATGETTTTIELQTSKFTVHVKNSDGNDFQGIAVGFNDYGNHYLSMGTTDGDGNAFIELFPGTRQFRATKDHTDAIGETTTTIEFQTAKAIGIVKDCDGTPLSGFKVSFNDYGNHWLTMGVTGSDGKASIELFPGTRKIQAYIDYTSEEKDLILTLTESTVEFNPTKVNFQFGGTVRYNDYGSHWKVMTLPFYLFAGTYDFKFDDQIENDVEISGCSTEQCDLTVDVTASRLNVYYGYLPESSSTLTATPSDGTEPYSYLWSTGGTDQSITVSPTTNTSYSVTVTDANGCSATNDIDIDVEDVTCGKNGDKVQIWHVTGNGKYFQICVSLNAIPAHLAHGDLWTLSKQNFSNLNETPSEFELNSNYPNPFNPATVIQYQIPVTGFVSLKVFDVLGNEVATLVNENQVDGHYEVSFNASTLSSGVYIYQLKINNYLSTKKMILMK